MFQTKYCCSLKVKNVGTPNNFRLATPLLVILLVQTYALGRHKIPNALLVYAGRA